MNVKQLEYFSKTCQFKSINQAAEKLFISQPSLSHSLKTLEDELDVNLFTRSKNGIQLTKEGQIILKDTLNILNIISGWKTLSKNNQSPNEIIIDGDGVIADEIIPRIISFFSQQNSKFTITSKGNDVSKIIEKSSNMFESSTIGMALIPTSGFESITKGAYKNGWNSLPIQTGNTVFLCSPMNPISKRSKISIDVIKESCTPVITIPATQKFNTSRRSYQEFDDQHIIFVPSRKAGMELVSLSDNFVLISTYLSSQLSEYIKKGKLVSIDMDQDYYKLTLTIFYSKYCDRNIVEEMIKVVKNITQN